MDWWLTYLFHQINGRKIWVCSFVLGGKITPCEAAKLQAMPDKFCASIESDKSAYKQLGNAVNVGIVGLVFQVLAGENLLSKPLILPTKAVQLDL